MPENKSLKTDLTNLTKLKWDGPGTAAKARAVVKKHASALREAFAPIASLPKFKGTTARDAFAYFVMLEAAWVRVRSDIRRATGLQIWAYVPSGKVRAEATVAALKGRAHFTLASPGDGVGGSPCDAFFAPLLRFPPMRQAVALVTSPHDVEGGTAFGWCKARPHDGAPADDLLEFLLFRNQSRNLTPRERDDLDALAISRVTSSKVVTVKPLPAAAEVRDVERWLLDVDAALNDTGILLGIAERGTKRLELSPDVMLGRGSEQQSIMSADIAPAVYARLHRMGAPAHEVLAAISRIGTEAPSSNRDHPFARKLDNIQWFRTPLRGGGRPWDVTLSAKPAKARARV